MKENDFLTLWNFTYFKDTSLGKNWCNFEHGLETKNEFEKWPLITFFQCSVAFRRLSVSAFGQEWNQTSHQTESLQACGTANPLYMHVRPGQRTNVKQIDLILFAEAV